MIPTMATRTSGFGSNAPQIHCLTPLPNDVRMMGEDFSPYQEELEFGSLNFHDFEQEQFSSAFQRRDQVHQQSSSKSEVIPHHLCPLVAWQQQANERGSQYSIKSTKKKRVTICGVDGGKYSLSGKRIGRPKVDRENTRCHECGTITTPQWRFLRQEELLSSSLPLRLPLRSLPLAMEENERRGKSEVAQRRKESGRSKSSGLTRKICLCNACWLRVHKAKQRLKNGAAAHLSSPRAAANPGPSSNASSEKSARLSSVLEELVSKDTDSSDHHGYQLFPNQLLPLPRSPLLGTLESTSTSSDLRLDASRAAASVIESAATLALRDAGDDGTTDMVWLAPGVRYGGNLQGQPVVLINGHEVLLLPSVHATPSPEERAHLHQVQQRIGQHILQRVAEEVRLTQREEFQQQQQGANRFQFSRSELFEIEKHQPESLEHLQRRQPAQNQLEQQQTFLDLLESSSSPFDSIFRPSTSPQHLPTSENNAQRKGSDSLATLTAVAQEFLSTASAAAAAAAINNSSSTPPNTSHMMAQLNALTLSPLPAKVSQLLAPADCASPLGSSANNTIVSRGNTPAIGLPEWQPSMENDHTPTTPASGVATDLTDRELSPVAGANVEDPVRRTTTSLNGVCHPVEEVRKDPNLPPLSDVLYSADCHTPTVTDLDQRPMLANHWLFY